MLALLAAQATGLTTSSTVDVPSLVRRARALPWDCASSNSFAFDSVYIKEGKQRGWSNWLITDRLMLGQYPHCQPAVPGPSEDDARAHLQRVVAAGIDCFVCLQGEVPPQDDAAAWPAGGVQLPDADSRAKWPAPFVRYAEDADALARAQGRCSQLRYVHCPITDLSVPDMPALLALLDQLLAHYEAGGSGVCAPAPGRARSPHPWLSGPALCRRRALLGRKGQGGLGGRVLAHAAASGARRGRRAGGGAGGVRQPQRCGYDADGAEALAANGAPTRLRPQLCERGAGRTALSVRPRDARVRRDAEGLPVSLLLLQILFRPDV